MSYYVVEDVYLRIIQCMCVCVCVFMCVCVFELMLTYEYACVFVNVYVHVCIHVHTCFHVHVHVNLKAVSYDVLFIQCTATHCNSLQHTAIQYVVYDISII